MTKQHSRLKRFAFVCIALSIPFLVLAMLEGLLRIAGVGQSTPLFIPSPHSEEFSLARPDIIRRYFPNARRRPSVTMEASLFLREKPDNGLRLFVQGGSTAAGYPYGLGAGIAGMLEQRLRRTLTNAQVEVVNTAMSAINSYAILDFADEIIRERPDAVLIYAGHNEYLGLLGVGSHYQMSTSPAMTRLGIALGQLRIVQLMRMVLESRNEAPPPARTLMARIAKTRDISHGSKQFGLGLEQFQRNLEAVLEKYRKAQVPVFLATLVSNLRDQPPFASDALPEGSQEMLIEARAQGSDSNEALAKLRALSARSDNARLSFELARVFDARGDPRTARTYYKRALQEDLLRFRAPPEINEIIRRTATSDGVTLVDFEAVLERRSRDGVIGQEFMLEHVHPNLRGYFLLADSFYQALLQSGHLPDHASSIPIDEAWRERPVLEAEEYAGFAKVMQLISDYPFAETPQPVSIPPPANVHQQLGLNYFRGDIGWFEMMRGSRDAYRTQGDRWNASKAQEIIATALPFEASQNALAAHLLMDAERHAQAQPFLERCLRIRADHPDCLSSMELLERMDGS